MRRGLEVVGHPGATLRHAELARARLEVHHLVAIVSEVHGGRETRVAIVRVARRNARGNAFGRAWRGGMQPRRIDRPAAAAKQDSECDGREGTLHDAWDVGRGQTDHQ